jgi:hypothetical protein
MKKYLLLFAFFFLFTPHAFAAVVRNHGAALASGYTGVTSVSWSHTATGDNYLIVSLSLRGSATSVTCTYATISMTSLGSQTSNTLGREFTFGLSNPTTGANTVACSWTTASNAAGISDSFSGVSSVGTVQTVLSTPSTLECDITATITSNDLLYEAINSDTGPTTVFGVFGTTATTSVSADVNSNGVSGGTISGSGSVTTQIHQNSGDFCTAIGVPIVGSAAATITQSILYLLKAFWW